MDNLHKTPNRPSGIPRLTSRIPLPAKSPSRSGRTSPSRDKLLADPGLDIARLQRPSEDQVFKKPFPKYPPNTRNKEILRNGGDIPQIGTDDRGGETELPLDAEPDEPLDNLESRGRRGVRPSLSERTVETLSNIPPSPASSRKSSFFNSTSPIRSPSRQPSSANSYSRSPSRAPSRKQSGTNLFSRSPSNSRIPPTSRIPGAPSFPANGLSSEHGSSLDVDSPSKTKSPSRQNLAPGALSPNLDIPSKHVGKQPATTKYTGARSTRTTETKTRPGRMPAKPVECEANREQKSLHVKKTRKAPPKSTAATGTSTTPAAPQQSDPDIKKAPKSSSALRESIAKAKAARRTAKQNPEAASSGPWQSIEEDPFNQKPKDSNKGLLRKRVEAARTTGHLNIAAMDLKEIPGEVMGMYDFDPNSSTDWYESVDLVKFIAADNELEGLTNAAFPDVDPDGLDSDANEKGNQFGGLEVLDLHGNVLRSLPPGIRKLRRLHTLNLSNNSLAMNDVEMVMEVGSLRDLKLANNQLGGSFTSNIGCLRGLQVLDLHGNSLTDLPESVAELTSLKVLNVSHNQLTSLPFECLSNLPLKEISAAKNKLEGTLIGQSVQSLEALESLDVTGNALKKLSERDDIELPNLQALSINANRIQRLPNLSSWKALLTLLAEDNALAELPQGFTSLKKVKNVDFTGNDISKLDERTGLMESLTTFRIANNPLRERKFLTMNTEDLLHDLRNRCEPERQETDDEEGSVGTQFTLPPESPTQTTAWKVKPGGVLDRSHSNMKELEAANLEGMNSQDIRCLYLQHNELRAIPSALSLLAHSLVDLDLSNNPLDGAAFLPTSVAMPKLQRLNLSGAGLSSIGPLLSSFSAPSLVLLDLSFNHLSGSLPAVRRSYPSLGTLLVANNQITSLEFDAVQGLQVLDVSNNEVDSLPPKLGLLRAEGLSKNWANGSALKRLEVAGNRFRVPRWQIVLKGTDAVLTWLKDRIPTEELSEWEPDEVL